MNLKKLLLAGILLSGSILAINGCSHNSFDDSDSVAPTITGKIETGSASVDGQYECTATGYDATNAKIEAKNTPEVKVKGDTYTISYVKPVDDAENTDKAKTPATTENTDNNKTPAVTEKADDNKTPTPTENTDKAKPTDDDAFTIPTVVEVDCHLSAGSADNSQTASKDIAGFSNAANTTATNATAIRTIGNVGSTATTLNVNRFTTIIANSVNMETIMKTGDVDAAMNDVAVKYIEAAFPNRADASITLQTATSEDSDIIRVVNDIVTNEPTVDLSNEDKFKTKVQETIDSPNKPTIFIDINKPEKKTISITEPEEGIDFVIMNNPDDKKYILLTDVTGSNVKVDATFTKTGVKVPPSDIKSNGEATTTFTFCTVFDDTATEITKTTSCINSPTKVQYKVTILPTIAWKNSTLGVSPLGQEIDVPFAHNATALDLKIASTDVYNPPTGVIYAVAGITGTGTKLAARSIKVGSVNELKDTDFDEHKPTTFTVCMISSAGGLPDCKAGATVNKSILAVSTFTAKIREEPAPSFLFTLNDNTHTSSVKSVDKKDTTTATITTIQPKKDATTIPLSIKSKSVKNAPPDAVYYVVNTKGTRSKVPTSEPGVDIHALFDGNKATTFTICMLPKDATGAACTAMAKADADAKADAKADGTTVFAVTRFRAKLTSSIKWKGKSTIGGQAIGGVTPSITVFASGTGITFHLDDADVQNSPGTKPIYAIISSKSGSPALRVTPGQDDITIPRTYFNSNKETTFTVCTLATGTALSACKTGVSVDEIKVLAVATFKAKLTSAITWNGSSKIGNQYITSDTVADTVKVEATVPFTLAKEDITPKDATYAIYSDAKTDPILVTPGTPTVDLKGYFHNDATPAKFTVCILAADVDQSECKAKLDATKVLTTATFKATLAPSITLTSASEIPPISIRDVRGTPAKDVEFKLATADVHNVPKEVLYFLAGKIGENALPVTLDSNGKPGNIIKLFEDRGTLTDFTVCMLPKGTAGTVCKYGATADATKVLATATFKSIRTASIIPTMRLGGITIKQEPVILAGEVPHQFHINSRTGSAAKAHYYVASKKGAVPVLKLGTDTDIHTLFDGNKETDFTVCMLSQDSSTTDCDIITGNKFYAATTFKAALVGIKFTPASTLGGVPFVPKTATDPATAPDASVSIPEPKGGIVTLAINPGDVTAISEPNKVKYFLTSDNGGTVMSATATGVRLLKTNLHDSTYVDTNGEKGVTTLTYCVVKATPSATNCVSPLATATIKVTVTKP